MSDLPISSPYRSRPNDPVSEDERNRLNRRLTDAFSAGTIDEDDYNRRLDRLWSSHRLGELVPVVDGLPPAPTYDQPAIVTGEKSGGAPGSLAPTRSGVPMTLVVGGGVVAVVILVIIIILVLLL